ncbi:MAG: PASTA domain-containing protein [Candidatus Riflebacteria bacterium]|nr:PASTA domain-containing protein [Candidatus Riflebacteria bacterium]
MKIKTLRTRTFRLICLFLSFSFLLCIYLLRLFYLQVIQFDDWTQRSENNHLSKRSIDVKRGAILDRNENELAISVETYTLYVYTPELKSTKEAVNLLAPFLPLSREQIMEKISKRRGYVPVHKNIDQPVAVKISALKIPGVILEENYKRVYPQNRLASNLIGFASSDGTGLEGLELKFDRTLRGYPGMAVQGGVSYGEEDAKGTKILKAPAGGSNVILTIDSMIQHILETELQAIVKKYQPIDTTAIVMDPFTGEILGMACLPNYDLNKYSDSPADSHRNRSVVDFFEPGSCMKIFPAALGIMTGKITNSTHFNCVGHTEVMGKRIKCHGSHGSIDIFKAIAESCNSTMVQISQMVESRQLYKLYRDLGFGAPTELEVPSESQGLFYPPSRWSGLSAASLCFGQEIAVTGMQLVRAYSAIANDGWVMRPHLIKSIVSQNGDIREDFEPEKQRKVFSKSLAEKLRKMLQGVVDNGTGELAKLEEYSAGGKTSTAQKANPAGGYFQDKVVTSFIGIVPANNPRFVLFVAANEPKGDEKTLFGGKVAAPVFSVIADRILKHLKVPPEFPAKNASKTATETLNASQTKISVAKLPDQKNASKTPEKTASQTKSVSLNDFIPPDSQKNFHPKVDVIPDFKGLTLKEAASMAKNLDLPVQLVGNGVAVDQSPKAGSNNILNSPITVKFSPDGT